MTILSESFNTANSSTLGPDQSWTELVGGLEISSSAAVLSILNSPSQARIEADLSGVNHYCEMEIKSFSAPVGGGSSYFGPCCRYASGADTCYLARLNRASDGSYTVEILKRVAASVTSLAGPTSVSITLPVRLKLWALSTSLKIYLNNVEVLAITDSAITTGSRIGMHGNLALTGVLSDISCDWLVGADIARPSGTAASGCA